MKSSFSNVCNFKFVPTALLYKGIQNLEIINLSQDISSEYHTPGTAFFASEKNNSVAGPAYSNSLEYSSPGKLTLEQTKKLDDVGAIVIFLQNSDVPIVFYKNDYFSNTKLIAAVQSTLDKTSVSFNISTLQPL